MNHRSELIAALRGDFDRWGGLLAGLDDEQVLAPLSSSHWSTKDVVAHLWAWQQVSIARLEAALLDKEPEFPEWLAGRDPESEENLEEYNESIYQAHRTDPWASVHQTWRRGSLRFLKLAETIPEEDLLQVGRYPWLKDHPLSAVVLGSRDHHRDHLEPLLVLFGER